MSRQNHDANIQIGLTLNNQIMHEMLEDLFSNHYSDNAPNGYAVSIDIHDGDWLCQIETKDKKESFPFDMKMIMEYAIANIVGRSMEEIHDFVKNELYARINANIIRKDMDLSLEHLDIMTSFTEPDESLVYRKINDMFFIPNVIFLYKDIYENKQLLSMPISREQLGLWDMDEQTIFDLAFESLDRRLIIDDINEEYNGNSDIEGGKVFYTLYDKSCDDLYGSTFHNMYSAKFRQYIAQNYEDGAFVSFPHRTMGFVWPKNKLSHIKAITTPKDKLADRTYIINNVIHFDDELLPEDKNSKRSLYYVPADICKEIYKCC